MPVLLTTRETTGPGYAHLLDRPELVWMVPFGRPQVRQYVDRYFHRVPNGPALAKDLRDRLRLSPGPRTGAGPPAAGHPL